MAAHFDHGVRGSEASEDHEIQLSWKTAWQEVAPDTWEGRGQRLFAMDAGEAAILEARKISLDTEIKAEDIVAQLTAEAQAESEPLDG